MFKQLRSFEPSSMSELRACPLFQLVSVVILLLAPLLTSCMSVDLPLDCSDIYNQDKSRPSGVYTVYPIRTTSAAGLHVNLSGIQVDIQMIKDLSEYTV